MRPKSDEVYRGNCGSNGKKQRKDNHSNDVCRGRLSFSFTNDFRRRHFGTGIYFLKFLQLVVLTDAAGRGFSFFFSECGKSVRQKKSNADFFEDGKNCGFPQKCGRMEALRSYEL
ncbi:hypothetical protein ElyMa_004702100 [Elysia marginata]|uniref:Uncharacterized protein n=1 Tax=Elysia marginata TaxID=1093978 RepID=A0AAV4I9L3_9GAST|nr:hypothetical protein ElyMa_004702100 [Elysia marginata]